jgi:hypothetical protein
MICFLLICLLSLLFTEVKATFQQFAQVQVP